MTEKIDIILEELKNHKVQFDRTTDYYYDDEIYNQEIPRPYSKLRMTFDSLEDPDEYSKKLKGYFLEFKNEVRNLTRGKRIDSDDIAKYHDLKELLSEFKGIEKSFSNDTLFTSKPKEPLCHPDIEFNYKYGSHELEELYDFNDEYETSPEYESFDTRNLSKDNAKSMIQPFIDAKLKTVKELIRFLENKTKMYETLNSQIPQIQNLPELTQKPKLVWKKEPDFFFILFSILLHGNYIESSNSKEDSKSKEIYQPR